MTLQPSSTVSFASIVSNSDGVPDLLEAIGIPPGTEEGSLYRIVHTNDLIGLSMSSPHLVPWHTYRRTDRGAFPVVNENLEDDEHEAIDVKDGDSVIVAVERLHNNLDEISIATSWNPHQEGPVPCCPNIFQAIYKDHRNCFRQHTCHATYHAKVMGFAAYHNRFHMMNILKFQHNIDWNHLVYRWAGMQGHIRILEWALKHGCPGHEDPSVPSFAAANGKLEALRWFHEHGFAWDHEAVTFAAEGGHLLVLRYLLDHPEDCKQAVCRDRQNTMNPVLEGRCMQPKSRINHTTGKTQRYTFKCCCHPKRPAMRGYSALEVKPKAFSMASANGRIDVIRYLWQRHGKWNHRLIMYAVNNLPQAPRAVAVADDGSSSSSSTQVMDPNHLELYQHVEKTRVYERYLEVLRFAYDKGCPKPAYVCPTLFDGCEGICCFNCPDLKNFKNKVFPHLKPYVPKEINQLICEFTCEAYTRTQKRKRARHDKAAAELSTTDEALALAVKQTKRPKRETVI